MKFHQNFLMQQLVERKKKNAQFSLRAFARMLEISPSQLSGLINGKKNLTPRQAAHLIEKLNLNDDDSTNLIREMHPGFRGSYSETPALQTLSEDEFRLISEWYHFAILSLGELPNNQANSKWIAQKLGIDSTLALEAFHRLERMGLIEVRNDQFKQTTKPLTTTTDVPSAAVQSYHKQNLQIAAEKLEIIPVEGRQYLSITMASSPQKLEKAKKMIADFSQKLSAELECENPSDVYTLAIQLFPLTK